MNDQIPSFVHPEGQAAYDALVAADRPDLAGLIKDGRCPSYGDYDTAGVYIAGGRPWEDIGALHEALVLGHQVHDPSAHLDDKNDVRCPTCFPRPA